MRVHIDTERLNEARTACRMSSRSHADTAGVGHTVLNRLSDTGDATHMSLGDLQTIANAVGLELHDLILNDRPSAPDINSEIVGALLDHREGLSLGALCAAANLDGSTAESLIDGLAVSLHQTGLAIARDRDHLVLASAPRHTITDEAIEATQSVYGRPTLTISEVRLVHRAVNGTLGAKILDNKKTDGYLRTRKLQRSGLIEERRRAQEHLTVTDRVRFSLMR